jgi:hypothetical protein
MRLPSSRLDLSDYVSQLHIVTLSLFLFLQDVPEFVLYGVHVFRGSFVILAGNSVAVDVDAAVLAVHFTPFNPDVPHVFIF